MSSGRPYSIDMEQCPRCGQPHEALLFVPFDRPTPPLTHWGTCPTTAEPIVMKELNPEEQVRWSSAGVPS